MPTLGYWKIRGLGAAIRYQMIYQGIEYDLDEYEQGDAPDFSRQTWLDKKFNLGLDFPNLPYFIDGDFKITETVAIHKYIADKWNPELLGSSPQEKAKIGMVAGNIGDLKGGVTMPCYTSGNREEIITVMHGKLPSIVAFMGNNDFLVGGNVTWVDFFFFELVCMLKYVHEGLFNDYPALQAYHERMSNLPKLKEYLSDPSSLDNNRPFNNKVAKLGGSL